MFESMGMDVSHVLMGDMRNRISQYMEFKLNHHRQDIYMYEMRPQLYVIGWTHCMFSIIGGCYQMNKEDRTKHPRTSNSEINKTIIQCHHLKHQLCVATE
jgi:hypothetical protein